MKHLKHLLAALVFVSLIVFTNCGSGKGGPSTPDPANEQAKLLVNTWSLVSNGAKLESASIADWNGMTLTWTGDGDGGTYSVSGTPADTDDVWPSGGGTWEFDGTDIGTIVRSDNVDIDISSVTTSSLTLAFTIDTSTRTRSAGIDGNWTFTFSIN